jgi:membrane associated rhomboid family serine protease
MEIPNPACAPPPSRQIGTKDGFWGDAMGSDVLRRRRLPRVAAGLAVVIVLAHVARLFLPIDATAQLFDLFAVIPVRFDAESRFAFTSPAMWPLPLLGHVFLHAGFLHLFFNTVVLLQASGPAAARLGAARFAILFFVSAIGAAVVYIGFNPGSETPAIGASGAVCGVFAAFMLAQYSTIGRALAAKSFWREGFWFLAINVGLAAAARMANILPIAWEAHLGGFLAGLAAFFALDPGRASFSSR